MSNGIATRWQAMYKIPGEEYSQAEGDIYARRNQNPFHREARSLKDGEVLKYKNKINPVLSGLFVLDAPRTASTLVSNSHFQ